MWAKLGAAECSVIENHPGWVTSVMCFLPPSSPIQESRIDQMRLFLHGTSAYIISPLKSLIHFYANGRWCKGILFFCFLFLNHVPHSIRQKVYTFYLNDVFCKPISREMLINSYFKTSKGNAFLSCSQGI